MQIERYLAAWMKPRFDFLFQFALFICLIHLNSSQIYLTI